MVHPDDQVSGLTAQTELGLLAGENVLACLFFLSLLLATVFAGLFRRLQASSAARHAPSPETAPSDLVPGAH